MQGRRQETIEPILNGCKVALLQKRYTWRHNNLIKYITGFILKWQLFDVCRHPLPDLYRWWRNCPPSPPIAYTAARPKIKVDQREINILNCKSVKGGYQFCLNFLPYSLSHSFLKSHEKSYKKSLTRYVLFPKIRKELKKKWKKFKELKFNISLN